MWIFTIYVDRFDAYVLDFSKDDGILIGSSVSDAKHFKSKPELKMYAEDVCKLKRKEYKVKRFSDNRNR